MVSGNHNHNHSHVVAISNRAFALAVALNLLFTCIEASYAFVANSASLLADAGHNLSDVLGLLMAWGASWLLGKNASERYSYGYKKTTILAALTNALLLVLACAMIAYESLDKLFHPIAVHEPIVMLVACIGIIVNGGTALLFMKKRQDDLNVKGVYLHLLYDALISVGVVIGAMIIYVTGWLWLDPVVGLLIVVIVLWGTWDLLRGSINLILGAVPHGVDLAGVRAYLDKIPGVVATHDLHIWALSTQENALTAHLVMPVGVLSDADFSRINHDLKHHFKISHTTLQVETGDANHPCDQSETC